MGGGRGHFEARIKVPNPEVSTLFLELRYLAPVGKCLDSEIRDIQIYIRKLGSKSANIELKIMLKRAILEAKNL